MVDSFFPVLSIFLGGYLLVSKASLYVLSAHTLEMFAISKATFGTTNIIDELTLTNRDLTACLLEAGFMRPWP